MGPRVRPLSFMPAVWSGRGEGEQKCKSRNGEERGDEEDGNCEVAPKLSLLGFPTNTFSGNRVKFFFILNCCHFSL